MRADQKLKILIKEAIEKAQKEKLLPKFDLPEIVIEHPTDEHEDLGDYASPVAMQIAKRIKKKPLEVVRILAKLMRKEELIGKIEGVEPGFMNFRLNPSWLAERINDIVTLDKKYGGNNLGRGKSALLEFVSANPTGPLHMGNGRQAFFADILGNVLAFSGFKVKREYYVNDRGTQVDLLSESILRRILELQDIEVEFPKEMYQGAYVGQLAQEIIGENVFGERVWSEKDLADRKLKEQIADWAVKRIVTSIKTLMREKLKINYDRWFYEKELYEKNDIEKVLKLLKKKKLAYEKDGALWFASKKFGDDLDRVLVRKNGEKTYFASDIAYHLDKVKRGFDLILDFWGADHHGYVQRLMGAMEGLGYKERVKVLVFQMVRLLEKGKEVKMSKRTGEFITLEELVDAASLSVARFFFITKAKDSPLDFDLDKAKEQTQKNPVFYVQYAHARVSSILRKAKEQGIIQAIGFGAEHLERLRLTHTSSLNLIRELIRFPEIVEEVAKTYEVQKLPQYAIDLAKAFQIFYENCPVIVKEEEAMTRSRIQLAIATKITLRNLLNLMGIDAPEVM